MTGLRCHSADKGFHLLAAGVFGQADLEVYRQRSLGGGYSIVLQRESADWRSYAVRNDVASFLGFLFVFLCVQIKFWSCLCSHYNLYV